MRTPSPAICLFFLGACGGGSNAPQPVAIDLPAILASSDRLTTAGSIVVGNDRVFVGDIDNNLAFRGFFSFEIGQVPDNVAVTAAELYMWQMMAQANPYDDFPNLLAESVDIGMALDATGFAVPVITSGGCVTPHDATLGTRRVNALQMALADRAAARTVCTVRLRFTGSPGTDGTVDQDSFALAPADQALAPASRITYQP